MLALIAIWQTFPFHKAAELFLDCKASYLGNLSYLNAVDSIANVYVIQPPPSYQPEALRTTPPEAPATSRPASKAQSENLITRYKLESKVEIKSTDGASGDDAGAYKQDATWSQNRVERQRLLQKRRDDMILAARRKMLEKEKAAKAS